MLTTALHSGHARAIIWAQWRSIRNHLPRANKVGIAFTVLLGFIWYGLFAVMAAGIGAALSDGSEIERVRRVLPAGLFVCFLYWQIVPLLLASKGSSLDLRKLLAYPVPLSEFFVLDVLLRLSIGFEVLLALLGAFVGLLLNPAIRWWMPFAIVPFVFFNMFFAAGMHDFLGRLLMKKRVREIAALLFILAVAAPQLMLSRTGPQHAARIGAVVTWAGWPWAAAGAIADGTAAAMDFGVLLAWTAAAYVFGRWQFERMLRFDGAESRLASERVSTRMSRLEWFYNIPNLLLPDPLASLVEKELRFLTRAPRFRLVFIMGFSFGLIIWWPMAFGRAGAGHSFMQDNYLTIVSLYAVLLLSDVLFWNAFGFDRSAAQLYFVAPLKTATVLMAKNVAAGVFVFLEVTIAVAVCLVLRFSLTAPRLLRAYAVTAVMTVLLVAIGNLTSLYSPRAVDPSKSFRTSRSGRVQALILLIYPIAAIPLLLAYGARYAFESELAFYGVLAITAAFAGILYKIALDSAVKMASLKRESFLAALSGGEGPIES